MKNLTVVILVFLLAACQKEDLTQVDDVFTIRTNDAHLVSRVIGNAESKTFFLVLHGGPGGSGTMYNVGRAAKAMEEKYAMIYLDQRGQGKSQGQHQQATLSLNSLGEDLVAVVAAVKEKYGQDKEFVLWGHSWGGMYGTAALLDSTRQSLFKGWIEVGGAHDQPAIKREQVKMFNRYGDQQIALGNDIDFWRSKKDSVNKLDLDSLSFEEEIYLNKSAFDAIKTLRKAGYVNTDISSEGGHGISLVGGNILTTWWSGLRTNHAIFDENDMFNLSLTNQLDKITLPTLIMYGKYDFICPPGLGIEAYNQIGSENKRLEIFSYSGHDVMLDEPDRYLNEVEEFMNSL